ncbi:hypothetical protein TNCV_3669691 [Trichonephila clavipes]|nr:hypothetical protein TNCV_3669691 [Trichonephila clavipes]
MASPRCAAVWHRLLVESCDEAALNGGNAEIGIEDKEHSGRILKDSYQTQELAIALEVTQQATSHWIKSLGMIQNQRYWVPYELVPRNVGC